ncbi:acyl-ACP desaturase [Nocardia sp. BMG51109]|uniref:acyl-ACP desaturase n=1 Tax=Nocardia sp. BMG51109 TaxID=1056816 RepID=UPI000466963C|nr:acyl-ACP desaturase [Nocardia sp. BMG51109]
MTGEPDRQSGSLPVLPTLPLGDIRAAVAPAVQLGASRGWSLADIPWENIRPELLTDNDRSVVRFITFIEDHIPGYMTWLLDAFPVDGRAGVDAEQYGVNREYFRFFVAWAHDEERHASALTRYQTASGMAETDGLLRELAAEGVKHFSLPYEHPLQSFTYTLLQEKATQLFYHRFHAVVNEPVLRELLRQLGRDEARHFSLYYRLVENYLRHNGTRAIPHLKDVLHGFQMPLSETLTGYWRWSLRVADSVGYDHTEAYDALLRLVREQVDAPGGTDAADLIDFVSSVRDLS